MHYVCGVFAAGMFHLYGQETSRWASTTEYLVLVFSGPEIKTIEMKREKHQKQRSDIGAIW